jgi:hypothetical protein
LGQPLAKWLLYYRLQNGETARLCCVDGNASLSPTDSGEKNVKQQKGFYTH